MARQKTHRHACIDCSTPMECGGVWEQNHDALTEVFCAEFEKYRDEWRCDECLEKFEAAQDAEREAERKAEEEADAQSAQELAEAIIAHTQAEATLTVAGDSSDNTPDVTFEFAGEWKWFDKFDTVQKLADEIVEAAEDMDRKAEQ